MLHKSLTSSSLAARAAIAGAALAMLASGLAAQSARASRLVYEPFNYTSGSVLKGQTATGTGLTGTWSGSNYTVSAGSLSEGNLATADNSVTMPANGGFYTVAASLASSVTATSGNPVWASFLLQTPSVASGGFSGTSYGGLNLVSTGNPFFGISYSSGTSGQQFVVQKEGGGGPNGFASSPVPAAGSTYLLVMEDIVNSSGPDTLNLWVNPTAGAASPPVTPDATVGLTVGSITGIQLVTSGNYSFDEVRIGTTYADVTPAVPEPATLGLVAIGAIGLLLLKRRRTV